MSFLDTIKSEMIENASRTPCCRRTLLLGMLSARGTLEDGDVLTLRLPHEGAASFAKTLIKEQFGRQAERVPMQNGGRQHLLTFQSVSAARFLKDLEEKFLSSPLSKPCAHCASAYLVGLFLAAGRITDPQKAYHLELSLGERAAAFIPFLSAEYGFVPRLAKRKNETLLYVKNSSAIEEIMTWLGINDAAFLFMNCKIEKEFRNEANRRTNCEAGNITRSVNAAARVLAVLRRLDAAGRLSSLPEELEAIARLRLENPEASLTQLAAMTSPPLTKSGVHHRLQKVIELSERLFGGSDQE
ncbi:MAG: DNA-binding protein WhiA [Clostridia bacterium]|nr:DNA-binding protein WhiA [Clostridia bacterium]